MNDTHNTIGIALITVGNTQTQKAPMDLNLKRVRYFLALAQTLNISQAARKLGMSQPALTKAIQRLEEEVGGPLIRREGRHTHLTQLGSSLIGLFESLVTNANYIEQTAQSLVSGDNPVLRIGVMCSVGPGPISGFLAAHQLAHPKIQIQLQDYTRSEIAAALLDGRIDLAILGATIKDETRFRYARLYDEAMVVACASDDPLAGRPAVGLKDVARRPYLDRSQCEFRHLFLSASQREGFVPRLFARSDNEDWIQNMIQAGAGVAIVPDRWVTLPGITKLKLKDPKLVRTVSVATPIGRADNPALMAILQAMQKFNWAPSR
jgi:LysR family hydrogen peroxide-inducible transcriptional activator